MYFVLHAYLHAKYLLKFNTVETSTSCKISTKCETKKMKNNYKFVIMKYKLKTNYMYLQQKGTTLQNSIIQISFKFANLKIAEGSNTPLLLKRS